MLALRFIITLILRDALLKAEQAKGARAQVMLLVPSAASGIATCQQPDVWRACDGRMPQLLGHLQTLSYRKAPACRLLGCSVDPSTPTSLGAAVQLFESDDVVSITTQKVGPSFNRVSGSLEVHGFKSEIPALVKPRTMDFGPSHPHFQFPHGAFWPEQWQLSSPTYVLPAQLGRVAAHLASWAGSGRARALAANRARMEEVENCIVLMSWGVFLEF